MADLGHGATLWDPIRANLHDPYQPVRCSPHRQRHYDKLGNRVAYDRERDLWFVHTSWQILALRRARRKLPAELRESAR